MDLRKKRKGERARVRVKATEGEREVCRFVVVDDLLLCSGPSGSVGESQLGDILKKDSVQEAIWRKRQSAPARHDAQNPGAERWSHKRPTRGVDIRINGTELSPQVNPYIYVN